MNTATLEANFNATNGQCNGKIVNEIVTILFGHLYKSVNPFQFAKIVRDIASSNTKTDLKEAFSEKSHFDSETMLEGSQVILKRYIAATNSIQNGGDYDEARRTFGAMLHTLQDFYSHTNYIELEHTEPSQVLGRRHFNENEYASKGMQTCVDCTDEQCHSNLHEDIVKKKLLTSGYFVPILLNFISKKKPKGKCSHGGSFDSTTNDDAKGGINKDKLDSVHGYLHYKAASMAYQATVDILKKFWNDTKDEDFGLFLGLKKNLNSLMVSIDTACSMAEYVELAKQISVGIVNQYKLLDYAPHNYILTSFNSELANLIVNTREPSNLISVIQQLSSCEKKKNTSGELYYHGLVEGLKVCEYGSVVYTFTDSPAKDAYLKHQALALIRNKKIVVYSLIGQEAKTRALLTPKIRDDVIDPLDGSGDNTDLATISGGLTFPITVNDTSAISQFVLRRLEWTRLQPILLLKSNGTSISFQVDSSINELQIDITSISEINNISKVELKMPNNTLYRLHENSEKTKHLHMWNIPKPTQGTWQLTTEKFSQLTHDIQIQGKTNLTCSSTLQKTMLDAVDSSGYTQLTTEPIVHSNLTILTTCENLNLATAGVQITIIDQFGSILSNLTSFKHDEIGSLTNITIPSKKFRIVTLITIQNGSKIQRIEKQLISPTTISIEVTNQPFFLPINESIRLYYTIKSYTKEQVTVLLHIIDTLKLLGDAGIEKNLTFVDNITGSENIRLPNDYNKKLTTDLVTFAISINNKQTQKNTNENDETKKILHDMLQIKSHNSVVHARYALVQWSLQAFDAWREKIKKPAIIANHLKLALEYEREKDNIHKQLLYYLGRLKYDIAHFSCLEKFVYSFLSIPIPKATLGEAYTYFLKVYELDAYFEQNLFYLAIAAYELHYKDAAIQYFKYLIDLPNQNNEVTFLQNDAAYLLTELLLECKENERKS
ncbi:unnamed protein product [Didymodactylos carnosus]|uniref:Uncharacterized protein n=1 Tax=Didymodactylos carnosus TaxID=1234261 RepID=A0A813QRS1_9BILA|nr:unnamed protein product [Didymodactylos carnosus]CAF0770920.1 unnamed protein product [Didymodactylos carnosus]CAF3542528.1 unnamed protein product [Didymodactylos carnosus]CAF3553025.1 unnamed protein product [Didymodactylos carnosus]